MILNSSISSLSSNIGKIAVNQINTYLVDCSSNYSSSNNPISIADSIVQKSGYDITYVVVGNNTGITNYAPFGYTIYTIFHRHDTVTVFVTSYGDGTIKTRSRSKGGSWTAWKTATMT